MMCVKNTWTESYSRSAPIKEEIAFWEAPEVRSNMGATVVEPRFECELCSRPGVSLEGLAIYRHVVARQEFIRLLAPAGATCGPESHQLRQQFPPRESQAQNGRCRRSALQHPGYHA